MVIFFFILLISGYKNGWLSQNQEIELCIVLVVSDKRKAKASGITQKKSPNFFSWEIPQINEFLPH